MNVGLQLMNELVDRFFLCPTQVVSGMAPGVDTCGIKWAQSRSIPIIRFKPNWDEFDKAAGPLRNAAMAEYSDALLLIWDGKSRGSFSMYNEMRKTGKPIYEVILRGIKF